MISTQSFMVQIEFIVMCISLFIAQYISDILDINLFNGISFIFLPLLFCQLFNARGINYVYRGNTSVSEFKNKYRDTFKLFNIDLDHVDETFKEYYNHYPFIINDDYISTLGYYKMAYLLQKYGYRAIFHNQSHIITDYDLAVFDFLPNESKIYGQSYIYCKILSFMAGIYF